MMRVLSIDIGTTNYTCCAANFSEQDDLPVKCMHTTVNKRTYKSVELVDIFNLNLTPGTRGTNALDVLATVWDNLVLFQSWTPDTVLIEKQLTYATQNYSLSVATYTLSRRLFSNCSIHFVPPKKKFTCYKVFFPLTNDNYVTTTYKQRKDTAVLLANRILGTYFGVNSIGTVWRSEGFGDNKATKLDDCADAFLQLFCTFKS